MTELIPPGARELRRVFIGFQYSMFRLETLQTYSDPGEAEGIAAFLAGRPEPPDPDHDAWCAQIAVNVGAGKSVQRVHVVREPSSDYLRYELTWGYAPNVRAGEDVRIIPVRPTQDWPPGVPQDDFWLFDDTELYRMHYSPDGTWLGVERVTEREAINASRVGRDAALRLGTPWATYLSDHPDLTRHLDLARTS
ncbi:MAG: DUF6879 family protein [Pseudonocardiales bacterium]